MIRKSEEFDPVLLSGTHAMEGSGRFLVTAVGLNSQTGIIMSLLGAAKEKKDDKKEEPTTLTNGNHMNGLGNGVDKAAELPVPEEEEVGRMSKSVLQTKLSNLALQIGYIGSIVAAATVLILIIRHCISKYAIEGKSFEVST